MGLSFQLNFPDVIMDIVIELQSRQDLRGVHDGANLFIQTMDGEDGSNGIT